MDDIRERHTPAFQRRSLEAQTQSWETRVQLRLRNPNDRSTATSESVYHLPSHNRQLLNETRQAIECSEMREPCEVIGVSFLTHSKANLDLAMHLDLSPWCVSRSILNKLPELPRGHLKISPGQP